MTSLREQIEQLPLYGMTEDRENCTVSGGYFLASDIWALLDAHERPSVKVACATNGHLYPPHEPDICMFCGHYKHQPPVETPVPIEDLERFNCDCLNYDEADPRKRPADGDDTIACERWVYLAEDVDAKIAALTRERDEAREQLSASEFLRSKPMVCAECGAEEGADHPLLTACRSLVAQWREEADLDAQDGPPRRQVMTVRRQCADALAALLGETGA